MRGTRVFAAFLAVLGVVGILATFLALAGNGRYEVMNSVMISCSIVVAGSIIALAISWQGTQK